MSILRGGGECKTLPDDEKHEPTHLFDGFLLLLRGKKIPVSTPEWLQFLRVISKTSGPDDLKRLATSETLLARVRLFAQTTLVKNKEDEAAFHEAFDQYFCVARDVFDMELKKEEGKASDPERKEDEEGETREGETPDIKEQLGIKEVDETLDAPEGEHEDDETKHGGKKDQHNDILKKQDAAKEGGGNKKKKASSGEGDKGMAGSGEGDKGDEGKGKGDKGDEGSGQGEKGEAGAGEGDKGEAGGGKGDKGEAGSGKGSKGKPSGMGQGGSREDAPASEEPPHPAMPKDRAEQVQRHGSEDGLLIGGGKGKSVIAHRSNNGPVLHKGGDFSNEALEERRKTVGQVDRRRQYEVRPDRASMRQVIRDIRKIILDVSETKSRDLDLQGTVGNFARGRFSPEYQQERQKQAEIVLFIDVGGPVDEWSPLVQEVVEAMSKGLSKLEVYLFHNNLYGYVWKPNAENPRGSNYAEADSLIDVKAIVKKRKKVIIYGDAEMSATEFQGDGWPPEHNEDRIRRFGMGGEACLRFVKRAAEKVVWINPVFKKEWEERDYSGTIHAAKEIIPMHDLTIGGVKDAVKELMKR